MDVFEKVRVANALDLSALVEDVARQGIPRDQAEQDVERYRSFLIAMAIYPDERLVPAKAVDRVWHAHMLRPICYAKDCAAMLGRIADHTPGVYGTPEWIAAYSMTRKLVSFGHEMPVNPFADHRMAGAECFREPGEEDEVPLVAVAA